MAVCECRVTNLTLIQNSYEMRERDIWKWGSEMTIEIGIMSICMTKKTLSTGKIEKYLLRIFHDTYYGLGRTISIDRNRFSRECFELWMDRWFSIFPKMYPEFEWFMQYLLHTHQFVSSFQRIFYYVSLIWKTHTRSTCIYWTKPLYDISSTAAEKSIFLWKFNISSQMKCHKISTIFHKINKIASIILFQSKIESPTKKLNWLKWNVIL